ncbi:reverse transcriptase domain-containing protein [Tanacetum coccineum]
MVSGPEARPSDIIQATKERIKVAIHPEHQEQTIAIGSTLTEEGQKAFFMVKKHDDSWRMCVDFKDLNKACPKDGYSLPEIEWNVESLCEYSFKCFLDPYKGYHQIKMAKEDEEKTSFITSQGIFCYSKMPFGWKNAGATYQRLVDKAFQKQIGINLERCEKRPRTSVKGQILPDFIVERPEDDSLDTPMEAEEELSNPWTLFTNGSSCVDSSGAGLILTDPEGA